MTLLEWLAAVILFALVLIFLVLFGGAMAVSDLTSFTGDFKNVLSPFLPSF
jgi:hypothetical protein